MRISKLQDACVFLVLFRYICANFCDMVSYFAEDTKFVMKNKRVVSGWLKQVALSEGCTLGAISVIFCSDPYILDVNQQYLGHDYYTDIITFDYCEGGKPGKIGSGKTLNGDLFISIDTVKANSEEYGASFHEELHRVIVHGVLHLIGYDDHTEADVAMMRAKENEKLEMLKKIGEETC